MRDYLLLTKPRVVMLHLITAFSAMFLAAGSAPAAGAVLFTLAGGGLVAGASNTLNCYFDRDLDAMMPRTRRRPLPAGRLKACQALAFGIATASAGLSVLLVLVGLEAALLTGAALVYYVLVYTIWLKRRTCWSAVIGSGAGAIPPLVGWVAVTGRVEATPLLLFIIILLWTPPHFWALAILRRDEYEQAGIRVPQTGRAARWMLVFSCLLIAASIALAPVAGLGAVYLVPAALLGLGLLVLAARLRRGEQTGKARGLYLYSILYIVALFGAMVFAQYRSG